MAISKYNIESHKDGSEVKAIWVKGMIEQSHTTHVRTKHGTIALRPNSDGWRVDFIAKGSRETETIEAASRTEVLQWILARVNPEAFGYLRANHRSL